MRRNKIWLGFMVALMFLTPLFTGCTDKQEETVESKNKTIYELSVPGLLEYCVDETGEQLYYTVTGESVIYQCAMDGTPVAQFTVNADESEPNTQGFIGEQPLDAADLSGLCIYGDTLYCYRFMKDTLMTVDAATGECSLLTKLDTTGINKMAAGKSTVMIMTYGDGGKVLYVHHLDTGVTELVPVDNPQMFALAGEDTYWINVLNENGVYCFREYRADDGTLSELYESNFTYELSDMAYCKETGLVYGSLYNIQYVCFEPQKPKQASRFTAKEVSMIPAYWQIAGNQMFLQDREKEMIYYFEPSAFVNRNKSLKGYVTSELAITEWAGYNIELEVISWDELALKVLAEDRDYDFVVMESSLPETTALRDAMAYLPIPEDVIETYWAECWPCVKKGATHNGDIWMLPIDLYARGLVYSEENLAAYDTSIEDIKTMEDLCAVAKKLYAAGETGQYSLYPMQNNLLQEYLWKMRKEEFINFDTPEFRHIMEFIREEYKGNDYSDKHYRNSMVEFKGWDWEYDASSPLTSQEQYDVARKNFMSTVYLDEVAGYSWDYEKYVGVKGIRVCAAPGISAEEMPVQVNCSMLILNPNSENKEELLDFVKAMSENYIANPATYLSSNTERYSREVVVQDVCRLYQNGEMVFGMPDGLFTSYYQYVMGNDLDPDEVVKELNRVVNMYYGE